MEKQAQPLVSVVTPVYNGAKYLRECADSVLAQTYENWEYLIVNNCSTDESLRIAREYEAKDPRIHVHDNAQHLGMLENSNFALRQIPTTAKYCKILHADDWMMPECLERMVALAEENPSVSIVSSYRLEEHRVTLDGLSYPSHVVPGKEICRRTLLGHFYVFGAPSNLLFRCDAIRSRPDFYVPERLHSDTEACYEILRDSDFGFVHQVLTFTRRHNEASTAFSRRMNSFLPGDLTCLVKYGPIYLSPEEYQKRFRQRTSEYYRFLSKALLDRREKEFWQYHAKELANLGYPMQRLRLLRTCVPMAVSEYLFHPLRIIRGIVSRARKVMYSHA